MKYILSLLLLIIIIGSNAQDTLTLNTVTRNVYQINDSTGIWKDLVISQDTGTFQFIGKKVIYTNERGVNTYYLSKIKDFTDRQYLVTEMNEIYIIKIDYNSNTIMIDIGDKMVATYKIKTNK